MRLSVKVVPGSSRDAIAGWLGGTLKLRVRAPAERGRANAAAVRILAGSIGVSEKLVRIVSGPASARKIVEIEGLSAPEFRRRLSRGPAASAGAGPAGTSGS